MDPSLLHGGQILTDRELSSAPVCLRCREMADRCWQLVADRCYQAALEETWSFSPEAGISKRLDKLLYYVNFFIFKLFLVWRE